MSATAAIYARVSTGEQSTEQQVTALREAAGRMGLDVVQVVQETGSGPRNDRPGLVGLMEAARRHEFGVVLLWKLDRLPRSLLDLARNVDELRRLGVRLVAVTQGIDLDPAGQCAKTVPPDLWRPSLWSCGPAGKARGASQGLPFGAPPRAPLRSPIPNTLRTGAAHRLRQHRSFLPLLRRRERTQAIAARATRRAVLVPLAATGRLVASRARILLSFRHIAATARRSDPRDGRCRVQRARPERRPTEPEQDAAGVPTFGQAAADAPVPGTGHHRQPHGAEHDRARHVRRDEVPRVGAFERPVRLQWLWWPLHKRKRTAAADHHQPAPSRSYRDARCHDATYSMPSQANPRRRSGQ